MKAQSLQFITTTVNLLYYTSSLTQLQAYRDILMEGIMYHRLQIVVLIHRLTVKLLCCKELVGFYKTMNTIRLQ